VKSVHVTFSGGGAGLAASYFLPALQAESQTDRNRRCPQSRVPATCGAMLTAARRTPRCFPERILKKTTPDFNNPGVVLFLE
jgi:hypothetical protein